MFTYEAAFRCDDLVTGRSRTPVEDAGLLAGGVGGSGGGLGVHWAEWAAPTAEVAASLAAWPAEVWASLADLAASSAYS
ncbi:hypothetical protein GCM10010508_16520 [Streptomyces naganishii JCM 4654]|uniref:Uncharacterized protein n=1 Tax=Streptomyces naganishii JCM 4654 TaxID=1306179 RepID=A0A919CUH1_9ACTN|nr:hypothetical protein GCM10010508_16520 [Streptomyces naganishii JCM 4654]